MPAPSDLQGLTEHSDHAEFIARRLILLAFHFPPDTAIGARRWEKLAHFASERGWGIDVITVAHPNRDKNVIGSLPQGVRVHEIPFNGIAIQRWEQSAYKSLKMVKKLLRPSRPDMAPDVGMRLASGREVADSHRPRWEFSIRGAAKAYWAAVEYAQYLPFLRDAEERAAFIYNPSVHRAVVSSGPPHMLHYGALRISERLGIPLVMDMRDPWSLNEQVVEHLASPVWYSLADRLEARAVRHASLIVANTRIAAQELEAAYPDKKPNIIVAMNGYDDDPIPALKSSLKSPTDASERGGSEVGASDGRSSSRFIIAHAGTVYLDRDPLPFFKAIAKVIRANSLTPDQFGVEFVGSFASGDQLVRDTLHELGIADFVSLSPPVPHHVAMQLLARATVLLTLSGTNKSAIPAKVFEYMRFPAWLLTLSAPDSATATLLSEVDADVVAQNDIEHICGVITKRIVDFRAGHRPDPVAKHLHFSRAHQANVLLTALERVTLNRRCRATS